MSPAEMPARDLGSATTGSGDVQHFLGGAFKCTVTTNDPRVGGTATASAWKMDLWGTTDNGAGVQWGLVRLENADPNPHST